MSSIHGILFLFSWGRKRILMRDEQQFWNLFLLTIMSWFLAQCSLVLIMADGNSQHSTFDVTFFFIYSMVSLSFVQRLGMSINILLLGYLASLILWIIVLVIVNASILETMLLLLYFTYSCVSMFLNEMEFMQSFNMKEYRKVTSNITEVDLNWASKQMEIIVAHQYTLLGKNDLIYADGIDERCDLTELGGSVQENALLGRALSYASMRKDYIVKNLTQFSFQKVCQDIIKVFEAVSNSSLPLYTKISSSNILITADKSALELIIFTLLYEFAQNTPVNTRRKLCCISCEPADGTWHLRFRVSEMEDGRGTGLGDYLTNFYGYSVKGEVVGTMQPTSVSSSEQAYMTPHERIAECIASKHFDTQIVMGEPEYTSGLKIHEKVVKLGSDHFSVVDLAQVSHNNKEMRVTPEWIIITESIESESLVICKSIFTTIAIPFETMKWADLIKIVAKEPEFINSLHGIVMHKSLFELHEKTFKLIEGSLFMKMIMLCDWDFTPSDVVLRYNVRISECIFSKASKDEYFENILRAISSQKPRAFPQYLSSSVVTPVPARGRQISLSKNSNNNRSFEMWLVLLKELRSTVEGFDVLPDILDARIKVIRTLRASSKEDEFQLDEGKKKMSITRNRVLGELGLVESKVHYILNVFYPVVKVLKEHLVMGDIRALQKISARYSVLSSDYGLALLSCWFATVQEVLDIIVYLMEKSGIVHSLMPPKTNKGNEESKIMSGADGTGGYDEEVEATNVDMGLQQGYEADYTAGVSSMSTRMRDKALLLGQSLAAADTKAGLMIDGLLNNVDAKVINKVDEMIDEIEISIFALFSK